MMIEVAYLSSAKPSFRESDLEAILEASRRNNERTGLTGLLLYGSGSFLQLLEGDKEAVDACLMRIARDPRHSALRIVVRGAIERRSFGGWAMGFRSVRGDEPGAQNFINLQKTPLSATIPPDLAGASLAFLRSFYAANISARADAPF